MYGGQPVFHCRNVVQMNEWRSDGYEDDDENYLEDSTQDEDICYSECSNSTYDQDADRFLSESINRIHVNINELIESEIDGIDSNASDNRLNLDYNGRFTHLNECLFNLNKSRVDRLSSETSNKIFLVILIIFKVCKFLF